jgi:hypothetical protein
MALRWKPVAKTSFATLWIDYANLKAGCIKKRMRGDSVYSGIEKAKFRPHLGHFARVASSEFFGLRHRKTSLQQITRGLSYRMR